MLKLNTFSRNNAREYAIKYALTKNPEYFDYTTYGGNCTNYISQCLFAGAPKMNFNVNNGWYYLSAWNTSNSWINVEPFYNFLTSNKSVGPFASVSPLEMCEVGDIIQLRFNNMGNFSHSLIVTQINSHSPDGIFVCANTRNVKNVPLYSYSYKEFRLLHILGYRTEQ